MLSFIKLLVLSFCFLCVSCSTVLYPQPSADEPRARLRVMAKKDGLGVSISTGSKDICSLSGEYGVFEDRHYADIRLPSRENKKFLIGMPASPGEGFRWRELYIIAGKPMVIRAAYSSTTPMGRGWVTSRCEITAQKFTPEAGKDYELISGREGKNCYLLLTEMVDEKRIPIKMGWSRSGCK